MKEDNTTFLLVSTGCKVHSDQDRKTKFDRVVLERNDNACMLFSIKERKPKVEPSVWKAYSHGHLLVVIDQHRHAWLHSLDLSLTEYPINLSRCILRKVYSVTFINNDVRLHLKGSDCIVSWAQRQYEEYRLIEPKKSPPVPMRFYECQNKIEQKSFILEGIEKHTKDIEIPYAKLIEQVKNLNKQWNIKGQSHGKHYSLCWDENGKIYSWGHKSVGLGYFQDLEERYVVIPRQIEALDGQFVVAAHCHLNYSIALTSSGQFYQWGIQLTQATLTAQVMYRPTKITRFPNTVMLFKAHESLMSFLSFDGILHIWGAGAQKFTGDSNRNKEPTPITAGENAKVIDFDLGYAFIAIICADKNSNIKSEHFQKMKMLRLKSIKNKLKKQNIPEMRSRRLATQEDNTSKKFKKSKEPFLKTFMEVLQQSENHYDCHELVTKKKEYMDLEVDEPKMLQYIFSPTNVSRFKSTKHMKMQDNLESDRLAIAKMQQKKVAIVDRIQKSLHTIRNIISRETSERNNKFIKKKQERLYENLKRSPRNLEVTCIQFQKKKVESSTYEQRLSKAQTKKQQQYSNKRDRILANIRKYSQENKKKIRQEQQKINIEKRNNKVCDLLKDVLIREYICRVLFRPIMEARIFLIDRFSKMLALERCVRTLQQAFLKKYIRKRIKRLSIYQSYLIMRYLKKYQKKFNEKRRKRAMQTILSSVVKHKLSERLKFMCLLYDLTAKKLQKLNEWYKDVKANKLRAMQYKWNLFLINGQNVHGGQNLHIKVLPSELVEFKSKQFEDIKTNQIYNSLTMNRPELALHEFIKSHPIYTINNLYLKRVHDSIQTEGIPKAKPVTPSRQSKRVQFFQRKISSRMNNLDRLNILPFSKDYQNMSFPSDMQPRIPERCLCDGKWVAVERSILQNLLCQHLAKKQSMHKKVQKVYQLQLAQFIKKNYQQICTIRAKYIIIYNTLKPDMRKKRLLNQLTMILRRAGLLDLLKDDYLPEKHSILEEALKMPHCPIKPAFQDLMTRHEFREMFTQYYNRVQKAIKHYKVMDLKNE